MKLGVLGTGDVAQTLAAAWSNAGHEIAFGSRDLGAKRLDFPVHGLAETVTESDIVVNATLGTASVDTLSSIGPDLFAGKTLIDVANAFGPGFTLLYPNSSVGEKLQEALPAARVVKTMNTARITMFTDPAQIGPATVFLSGDDPAAKSEGHTCWRTSAGATTRSSTSETSNRRVAPSTTSSSSDYSPERSARCSSTSASSRERSSASPWDSSW
jgi:8-hydroxy-5-deazaflavin:NADPH oxidoreductase